MADISIINKDNTNYNVKDAAGRLALAEVENKGAKNLFDIDHLDTGGTYNALYGISNGVLSVTSNGSYGRLSTAFILPSGTYVMSCNVSNISIAGGTSAIRITLNPSGSNPIVKQEFTSSQSLNLQFTLSAQSTVYIMFYENESSTSYANSADFSNIMICTKAEWDISHSYVPYAIPNPTLTPAVIKAVDEGAKNRLPLTGESTDIFTINADGTMTANGSSSTSKRDFAYYIGAPPKGRFVFSGCPPTGSNTTYRMFLQSVVGSTYTTLATLTGDPVEVDLTSIDKIRVLMSIYAGYAPNNIKFSPMLCTKAEWDISQAYVPYAKTNADLTNENTSQQSEINYAINAGAKNFLRINASSTTINDVAFTVNSDGTVTVNGQNTGSTSATLVIVPNADAIMIPDGNYILSGCPSGGGDPTYDLRWYRYSPNKSAYDRGAGVEVSKSGNTTDSNIAIVVKAGVTVNNIIFKPMIRPASITDSTFVPYAPTNRELYEEKIGIEDVFGVQPQIADNTDLNTVQAIGKYVCGGLAKAQTFLNCPVDGAFIMFVDAVAASTRLVQRIYGFDTNTGEILIYIRALTINGWGSWYKFEGTEVT